MAQALGLLYTAAATLEVVRYSGPSFRILPVGVCHGLYTVDLCRSDRGGFTLPSPRPALFVGALELLGPSAGALGACRSTVSAPRLV